MIAFSSTRLSPSGDRRFQLKCQEELFVKRKDRAMIMVSHDPGFIQQHCHSAVVLVAGKLHSFNALDEAYAFYVKHDSEE